MIKAQTGSKRPSAFRRDSTPVRNVEQGAVQGKTAVGDAGGNPAKGHQVAQGQLDGLVFAHLLALFLDGLAGENAVARLRRDLHPGRHEIEPLG